MRTIIIRNINESSPTVTHILQSLAVCIKCHDGASLLESLLLKFHLHTTKGDFFYKQVINFEPAVVYK